MELDTPRRRWSIYGIVFSKADGRSTTKEASMNQPARFTHDGIDSRMMFAHDEYSGSSLYQTVDDLWKQRALPNQLRLQIVIEEQDVYGPALGNTALLPGLAMGQTLMGNLSRLQS